VSALTLPRRKRPWAPLRCEVGQRRFTRSDTVSSAAGWNGGRFRGRCSLVPVSRSSSISCGQSPAALRQIKTRSADRHACMTSQPVRKLPGPEMLARFYIIASSKERVCIACQCGTPIYCSVLGDGPKVHGLRPGAVRAGPTGQGRVTEKPDSAPGASGATGHRVSPSNASSPHRWGVAGVLGLLVGVR
jgi:hypothetical protein